MYFRPAGSPIRPETLNGHHKPCANVARWQRKNPAVGFSFGKKWDEDDGGKYAEEIEVVPLNERCPRLLAAITVREEFQVAGWADAAGTGITDTIKEAGADRAERSCIDAATTMTRGHGTTDLGDLHKHSGRGESSRAFHRSLFAWPVATCGASGAIRHMPRGTPKG